MTIYAIPNPTKREAFTVMAQAARLLHSKGLSIVADKALQQHFAADIPIGWMEDSAGFAACDIILTIGGDGTILHTARQALLYHKPLLGINTGHLGFLTILEQDELQKLHRLAKGEYTVEERSLLRVVSGSGEEYALNDAVLFKHAPEKTIALDIYCDDILVSSFRGDGVIFATPTGSTAYSMSAGGPIVDARLDAVVVTQICAHIIHTPPMVFTADRTLRVVQQSDDAEQVFLSCDGLQSHAISKGDSVLITRADTCVPLIQFADSEQVKSIDKKLKGR